jgi:hypothetical protein
MFQVEAVLHRLMQSTLVITRRAIVINNQLQLQPLQHITTTKTASQLTASQLTVNQMTVNQMTARLTTARKTTANMMIAMIAMMTAESKDHHATNANSVIFQILAVLKAVHLHAIMKTHVLKRLSATLTTHGIQSAKATAVLMLKHARTQMVKQ